MAFPTNSLVDFFGTQDLVTHATATSAVANNAFSVVGANDVVSWTNSSNAPWAVFVIRCQFGTAPTDGSLINIHARKLNVQGTNDSPVPTAINSDQCIGSFTVDGDVATATNAYLVTGWLPLQNHYSSQVYDFYFENKTGQQITAGWAVWITPCTKGPQV